jgi:nucleoside-diphosphate-sugar epimerase
VQGEKILITGPAGQIAFPICEYLAKDNEVWGIARFSDPADRQRVDDLGVTTRVVDLASGDFSELPTDFTYLLHLATFQGAGYDYDYALQVNAEGTGLLLEHCRNAKAALVMSTQSVYEPNPDRYHAYAETDPLGDAHMRSAPTYSVSKIAEEGVARLCARMFDLPVTIARMNAAYGPNGGLPGYHLDWMVAGAEIVVRSDPAPYSVIFQDDINRQVEAMLDAATVPATIVNWGGDEIVTAQEWCAYFAELTGAEARVRVGDFPGTQLGSVHDNSKRLAITGPCLVGWREGMRRMVEGRYPDGVELGKPRPGQAAILLAAYEEVTD